MIIFPKDHFSIKDTLECGQVFRFAHYPAGEPFYCPFDADEFERRDEFYCVSARDVFIVRSLDKVCYCYETDSKVKLISDDDDYFYNYFDLSRDYKKIADEVVGRSEKAGFSPNRFPEAVATGRGIRILNQAPFETVISFIISQNNNIPRIKGIIERLCHDMGSGDERRGYSFPTAEKMAEKSVEYYRGKGLGYRDAYVLKTAQKITDGYQLSAIFDMDTPSAAKELSSFYGVGGKVADCITLFAYHKTDSFPVDVWIDRAYKTMGGKENDRKKISRFLVDVFGEYSGYAQQYIFNYFMHDLSASE